jgi:hypothetical protein
VHQISLKIPPFTKNITRGKQNIPAVPQRPNPALKIVDPLLISATASSALAYTFDLERSIVGARLSFNSTSSTALLPPALTSLMKPRENVNVAATPARLLFNAILAVARGSCARNKALEDEGSIAERRVHERRVAAIVYVCVGKNSELDLFNLGERREEEEGLIVCIYRK